MGNILFYVLARHQPWSHLEEEGRSGRNNAKNGTTPSAMIAKLDTSSTLERKQESLETIGRAKAEGRLPHLPERYLSRPEATILWEAVRMCYVYDPGARPTALEIAGFLGRAYEGLLREPKEQPTKRKKKTETPVPPPSSKDR
eukprot:CAMPEP_0201209932 /NCGR_PEP_ID=MMETSP0851-20130426/179310_1 /ASSEMBLY_ACC=CAM_ASM_000631 /TAXON_ID=183588 /ORGANISM="Pseudo-nitzschia fraudulenta, Strain WWA7" /LENGTH=142 /DNA_ID=CAMNT_0047498663 /DNA_START=36 /DNA_END=464 /DNA_ORIENTATION=-